MLPVIAALLLLWGLFGAAVVVLIVYGSFAGVALDGAAMAAILSSGTAILGGLGLLLAWRLARRRGRR